MKPMLWMAGLVAAGLAATAMPHPLRSPVASRPAKRTVKAIHRTSGASRKTFMDGVIEGFYGPDWTVANTEAVLAFMAKHHLNSFAYAPKYDPYQRVDWNQPYPPKAFAVLRDIVQSAKQHHITFVYSVSPGLSINYTSPTDLKLLLAKIDQVRSLGVSHFMLSFDDIGGNLSANLASAQATLADRVMHQERLHHPDFELMFTPTLYDGLTANPYWSALKTTLYQGISVIWTGPYVLSATITTEEAKTVEGLIGHPLVIWDNYPVNDYTYQQPPYHPHLFMGPVVGRSAGLKNVVQAYFFNPMLQARASEVALWTGAAYLNHPDRYQPMVSWDHAITALGGKASGSLRLFAAANSESFMALSLNHLASDIQAFWNAPESTQTRTQLSQTFSAMASANATMQAKLPDHAFYDQISPWSVLFSQEGAVAKQALALWEGAQSGHPAAAANVDQLRAGLSTVSKSTLSLDTTTSVEQFVDSVITRLS